MSDGQSWTGDVARALQTAKGRKVPVFVVGIGTTVGGMIPEPAGADGTRPPSKIHSTLDRKSLLQIAVAAEVRYAYAPKNAELRRYADELSQHYTHDRTAIMRFVASNPRRLRRFADAFKLRDPE